MCLPGTGTECFVCVSINGRKYKVAIKSRSNSVTATVLVVRFRMTRLVSSDSIGRVQKAKLNEPARLWERVGWDEILRIDAPSRRKYAA